MGSTTENNTYACKVIGVALLLTGLILCLDDYGRETVKIMYAVGLVAGAIFALVGTTVVLLVRLAAWVGGFRLARLTWKSLITQLCVGLFAIGGFAAMVSLWAQAAWLVENPYHRPLAPLGSLLVLWAGSLLVSACFSNKVRLPWSYFGFEIPDNFLKPVNTVVSFCWINVAVFFAAGIVCSELGA